LQDYKINIKRKRNSNGVRSTSSKKSREKENKGAVVVVTVPDSTFDITKNDISRLQKSDKFNPSDNLKTKSRYPLLSFK